MLDAILFLRTGCSFGSSKPKEKLDPPPGGRSTLEIKRESFTTLHIPLLSCVPAYKTRLISPEIIVGSCNRQSHNINSVQMETMQDDCIIH